MGRVPPAAGKPQNSLHLSSSEKGPRWNSTIRSAPGQRPAGILSSGLSAENIRLHPASMIFSPRRGRRKDVQADGAISRGPPAISSFFFSAHFSRNHLLLKNSPSTLPFPWRDKTETSSFRAPHKRVQPGHHGCTLPDFRTPVEEPPTKNVCYENAAPFCSPPFCSSGSGLTGPRPPHKDLITGFHLLSGR